MYEVNKDIEKFRCVIYNCIRSMKNALDYEIGTELS